MAVMDARFASQAVTTGGRTLMYDAIECLVDHLNGHAGPVPEIVAAWVADRAASTGAEAAWLPVDEASIVFHDRLRTPMAGGLVALASPEAVGDFMASQNLADPLVMTWPDLQARGVDRPWVRVR